jgi:hypothetical protein
MRTRRVSIADRDAPPALPEALSMEQTVRTWYDAGHSQRETARELDIDRRKVKRIIDPAADDHCFHSG